MFLQRLINKRSQPRERIFSLFEFWPNALFYTPIIAYWVLNTLRFRRISTPFLANPRIEIGGLCSESKSAILDMAGDIASEAIAPYITFRNGPYAANILQAKLREKEFSFPIVIKPDIGSNGIGVRKVTSLPSLKKILALFPYGTVLIAQKLIDLPVEAGIFFIRFPDQKYGKITSITYKQEPVLVGDGTSTLLELALKNQRIKKLFPLYRPYLRGKSDIILPAGKKYVLVFAGNHRRGSIFQNGTPDITDSLEKKINKILRDIPNFYFGRIDLKVNSREDLLKGNPFQIIEINGVGSEATHIWDKNTRLAKAYQDQFHHYGMAFRIGHRVHKESWKPCSALSLLRAWKKHRTLIASYPHND